MEVTYLGITLAGLGQKPPGSGQAWWWRCRLSWRGAGRSSEEKQGCLGVGRAEGSATCLQDLAI